MNCPICGMEKLIKVIKTKVFIIKNKKIEIPNYITWNCHNCNESIVDNKTLKTSGEILKKEGGLTMPKEELYKVTCKKCGYTWNPRKLPVRICANQKCKSLRFDEQPKPKKEEK